MAEEATAEEIKPGSPEYDKQMADRFNNPQMPEDQGEEAAGGRGGEDRSG